MAGFPRIKRLLYIDTFGWIAVASLLICALTGVFLAIPYNINAPYESLTQMLISNAAASYVRNLHYWSAQFFLIFSVLHLYDHFSRSTENNIKKRGIWLRLTLSLVFLIYVMISGFILKADSDSQQARRILSALLESVPLAGKLLQQTFIGNNGNWQIIYIQHVATATIILFLAIAEHAKTIWVKMRTFVIVLLLVALISALFRAPISALNESVMKGPWYFVGLQEVLHWVSYPWMIMAVMLLVLALVFFIPLIKEPRRMLVKKGLLALLILYGMLTVTGFFFRGHNWQWQLPWKPDASLPFARLYSPLAQSGLRNDQLIKVQGKNESCLLCHSQMQGLSQSHSAASTGCYACHFGDPFSANKNTAHRGMEAVPGNLANASKTCGSANCHPQIVSRVNNGLMATLSGMITVDRYVFGETSDLNAFSSVSDLKYSAADIHLRNLCAGCHIGNEKTKKGHPEWLERGGGCNACHLTYNETARKDLAFQQKKPAGDTTLPRYHPAIDLNIGNDKCQSCHSRSGRISMNYEGWHETALKPSEASNNGQYLVLPDKRVFMKMPADIHHEKEMLCIDCHGSYELMGDGNHYSHKEQAVKVQCSDCHRAKAAAVQPLAETDRETQLIAWLRKYQPSGLNLVLTQKGNLPLVNTISDNTGHHLSMKKKSGAGTALMKPPSHECMRGNVHSRLSCEACHTAWVPQCIGCHNSYEAGAKGFDMIKNKDRKGTWTEYASEGLAGLPVLGIDGSDVTQKQGLVKTFTPGMIMTIDKGSFKKGEKTLFHRLYAPASAHTTRRESRSCMSCHNDPLAIGYGRGQLALSPAGNWIFEPKYELNKHDGLPEDAWTGFLTERTGQASTRKGMRPFNIAEQRRILSAGACLTCHDERSVVMRQSLSNFADLLKRKTSKCVSARF